MTVRELITKWGFDIEHEKLDKVEDQLEKIRHRLEFLAAAEVVKGIVELTERFSKFAEELHIAATSAGITVESFQKLAFAAQQNAVSSEEMGGAMARLSRHLYEARQGGAEAQKAFAQAGFSAEQIKGFHTGSDVMLALADRFKGIQDPIQKQALAMQLMGRGSVNMVGFLSQGSAAIKGMGDEAGRLGIVLGEKQVNALVKLEHAFQKVWGLIKGVSAFIAAELAPNVQYVIDTFLKWWEANQKLIQTNIKRWVYDFLYGLGFIWGAVEGLTKVILKFAATHKTLMKFIEVFAGIVGSLLVLNFAAKKTLGIFETFGQYFKYLKLLLANPFSLAIIAIGLMVVAVHDLWNAVHGKPTWIQHFIDWLGIGQQVQAVFFAIFQLLTDLFHLNFKGVFKDMLDDAKELAGFLKNLGESFGLGTIIHKVAAVAGPALNKLEGVQQVASTPATNAPQTNNVSNSYQVNAPITVNAEGADHRAVAESVKVGVREHLDRVHREATRSLRPVQAY